MTPGDKPAALLADPQTRTACYVDDLLRAWRDAEQQATDAYATWGEFASRDGHPAFVAALDREEKAAEVYAEARRRALEWTP